MKEELLLKQKFGSHQPFKVPEGFFESFEENFMHNIPEAEIPKKRSARNVWLRPMKWAACIAAVILVSGTIYFNISDRESDLIQTDKISDNMSSSVYSDYILDEISDYAMLDNDDIYSYVTNE